MKKRLLFVSAVLFVLCLRGSSNAFQAPFKAQAMAFYFLHEGGPLKLELSVKTDTGAPKAPAYLQKDGAYVGRIFDADERLVSWDYRRVKSGKETVQAHDFGKDAPAGVYQIRYSGENILVTPRAIPETPFALMPQRAMLQAYYEHQFDKVWVRIPDNAQKMTFFHQMRTAPLIADEQGNPVTILQNLDLASQRGKIWQISSPRWARYGVNDVDLIFCPTPDIARRLQSSLERTADGTYYPHKFQVRIHNWLRRQESLSPQAFTVTTVDLTTKIPEMSKDPTAVGLVGDWGLFTYVNAVIKRQETNPKHPRFCPRYVRKTERDANILLAAYAIKKPYNPYYQHPALEKLAMIPIMKDLLHMNENETWSLWADSYNGADALNFMAHAELFHQGFKALQDRELAALWYDAVRRVPDRFSMFRVSCENQSSHWPVIFTYLYEAAGNPRYLAMAKDYVFGMSRKGQEPFMRTGYLQEAYGPDATYQGLCTCYLALYYRLTHDPVAKDILQTIYTLFNHTVAPEPNGTVFGASNFSHRTMGSWVRRQYGGGLQLMKGILPEAAVWHQNWQNHSVAALFQEKDCAHGTTYATSIIGPFFDTFKYPSEVLKPAMLPVMQNNRFSKNFNHEFLAIRKPAYYACAYLGKTDSGWYYRAPRKPENNHPNNKWMQTQGLSMLWFPRFGSFILGMNWNANTAQILRADLVNGECAYPHYNSLQSTATDDIIQMSHCLFNAESVHCARTISFQETGITQQLVVTFKQDFTCKDLYEQIPFLKQGKKLEFQFLVNGNWQTQPGCATEIRINNQINLHLSRPLECDFGPDSDFRQQKMGLLRLHLGAVFKAGDTCILTYSIRG